MASSFLGYVDEAGCEGFSFDSGSSRWFVLSCLITRRENDLGATKTVDRVRKRLNKPAGRPLHFRDLRHEQRVYLVGEIAKQEVRQISVCVHKPSLREQKTFAERYTLYFCAAQYLLEKLSWFCRDNRKKNDPNDGTVHLIFSNRGGMSLDELKEYLRHLYFRKGLPDIRIDWSVIKETQVSVYGHGKRMGLQLVDAVASSFFRALETDQFGYTEPRYAEMLRRITYTYRGRCLGYGIKIWPRETTSLIETEENLAWLRKWDR